MQTPTLIAVDPADLYRIVNTAVANAFAAQVPPPPPTPEPVELLTRSAVAKWLSVSLVTLRQLEKRGELVPLRVARRVLYRRSDVLATLEKRRGN